MKAKITTKERAKIIGKRIQQLREEKNVSRQELAVATGLTVSAISNYELGIRVPRDEAKEALAEFFGVDVYTIFLCLETTHNV